MTLLFLLLPSYLVSHSILAMVAPPLLVLAALVRDSPRADQYTIGVGMLVLAVFGQSLYRFGRAAERNHPLAQQIAFYFVATLAIATSASIAALVTLAMVQYIGATVGIIIAAATSGIISGVGQLTIQLTGSAAPQKIRMLGFMITILGCAATAAQLVAAILWPTQP